MRCFARTIGVEDFSGAAGGATAMKHWRKDTHAVVSFASHQNAINGNHISLEEARNVRLVDILNDLTLIAIFGGRVSKVEYTRCA